MSPISIPGKVTLSQTQVFPDDLDAAAYVLAVEAADGQTLEPDVRLAYNTFIKGCKSDGIWDAIKASCILAGARTLSGALVPLKGTAPTNNNFVAGDYGRENGIHVTAVSKYLDTNRNNNADPQNSNHNACFVTNSLGGTQLVMGSTGGEVTGANTTLLIFQGNGAVRNRCLNASFIGVPPPNTFYGVNRNTSASFSYRLNGSNFSISRSSQTPQDQNVLISDTTSSGSRLSFYSIGESLDLALLDNRVSTLMSDIGAAIP